MFDGIGLGLTVRQLGADARSSAPGHRRARLSEVLPIAAWSDAEKAFELTRIQQARAHADRCGGESAVVQYQLLMHRPARPPLGSPPMLVLASPDDRLVPVRGVRSTAARYGAEMVEYPGMGHDLMLDARWREPLDAMLRWLGKVAAPSSPSS